MPAPAPGHPAPPPTLHLRSEDMQDIIEQEPSWLARWGISLVTGLVLGLLGLGYFVSYPDRLVVPVDRWVPGAGGAAATAEAQVAQQDYTKLRPGQLVQLTFDRYPASQYGYLMGRVGHVSDSLNAQGNFTVQITLPQGLETSRHQTLLYCRGMTAQASIVINDARLLERVL